MFKFKTEPRVREIEVALFESSGFVMVEVKNPIGRKKVRTEIYKIELNYWLRNGMDGIKLFMLDASLAIKHNAGIYMPGTKVQLKDFKFYAEQWQILEPILRVYVHKLQKKYNKTHHLDTEEQNKLGVMATNLPGMMQPVNDCPVPGCTSDSDSYLFSKVIHLNDKHKWTREAIAAWMQDLHDRGEVDIAFKVNGHE